jgi:phosphoglycolate phosphatase
LLSPALIVFDLDGTLVDSRRDIAEAANATLVSYGVQPLADEAIGRMVGDGAPLLVARAFETAGVAAPADALGRFLSNYRTRLLEHTRPYPGIPEVLRRLASRATLAVLTNKPLDATRDVLTGLGLAHYFVSGGIVAGDGPFARKPDPGGLIHLMTAARTTQGSTVLVGDSPIDWRTARNAGTRLCLARYGFGWERGSTRDLDADWFVDSPHQILQCLGPAFTANAVDP